MWGCLEEVKEALKEKARDQVKHTSLTSHSVVSIVPLNIQSRGHFQFLHQDILSQSQNSVND